MEAEMEQMAEDLHRRTRAGVAGLQKEKMRIQAVGVNDEEHAAGEPLLVGGLSCEVWLQVCAVLVLSGLGVMFVHVMGIDMEAGIRDL